MQTYSPFYMFLSYLQLGSIMLTFILQIIGIVVAIIAIRALLIYIKKNAEPNKSFIGIEPIPTLDSEENIAENIEEVEAEIVTPDSIENHTKIEE